MVFIINVLLSASALGIFLSFFMRVYLDESGDLGWNFNGPYGNGGSSRYLCLAFLVLPDDKRKLAKNLMSGLYSKYGWKAEKKASQASDSQRLLFCREAVKMLQAHSTIKIDCIIVKKENVLPVLRDDGNKLYNYMCKLVVPGYVITEPRFSFHPDKRSIKVESGNSLPDYLRITLGFECGSSVEMDYDPLESTSERDLQFVDWTANCVWRAFEKGDGAAYDILKRHIRVRPLFFF